MLHVQFCRLGGVVRCMMQVPLSGMRVMRRSLVVASFVVPGSFAMVACCVFVVLGSLVVVFRSLFGHLFSPLSPSGPAKTAPGPVNTA
jgi:hypothetical protein